MACQAERSRAFSVRKATNAADSVQVSWKRLMLLSMHTDVWSVRFMCSASIRTGGMWHPIHPRDGLTGQDRDGGRAAGSRGRTGHLVARWLAGGYVADENICPHSRRW